MKTVSVKNILLVVVASLVFVLIGGCGGSSDALLTFDANMKLLPNSEVHAGKGSTEIAQQANKSNVIRTAMAEDVVKNPDDLAKTMDAMGF